MSRPTRARGLKRAHHRLHQTYQLSRPTRARGLKRKVDANHCTPTASRPTRARGLKRVVRISLNNEACVAPHAGAWIETNFSTSAR